MRRAGGRDADNQSPNFTGSNLYFGANLEFLFSVGALLRWERLF